MPSPDSYPGKAVIEITDKMRKGILELSIFTGRRESEAHFDRFNSISYNIAGDDGR